MPIPFLLLLLLLLRNGYLVVAFLSLLPRVPLVPVLACTCIRPPCIATLTYVLPSITAEITLMAMAVAMAVVRMMMVVVVMLLLMAVLVMVAVMIRARGHNLPRLIEPVPPPIHLNQAAARGRWGGRWRFGWPLHLSFSARINASC